MIIGVKTKSQVISFTPKSLRNKRMMVITTSIPGYDFPILQVFCVQQNRKMITYHAIFGDDSRFPVQTGHIKMVYNPMGRLGPVPVDESICLILKGYSFESIQVYGMLGIVEISASDRETGTAVSEILFYLFTVSL